MSVPFAIAEEIWFLVAIIVILVAVIYSYYSRRGSDISQRPIGAENPEQPAVGQGASRISAAEHDQDEAAERQPPH